MRKKESQMKEIERARKQAEHSAQTEKILAEQQRQVDIRKK
jgi:hypothetical protein